MVPAVFEALAPVCPRCRAEGGVDSPLRLASVAEERAGHVWQGLLHCSNDFCWLEFPILDGVPILSPDPGTYLSTMRAQIMARTDLPAALESVIGDAAGPDAEINTDRYHLSLYGWSHYADWTAREDGADRAAAQIPAILELLFDGAAPDDAPVIDLGTGVGRGAFALAERVTAPVLGADMNFAMLRLAQRLLVEGRAACPLRRVGMVYDRVEVVRPDLRPGTLLDFWAVDAVQAPFRGGRFATAMALNLVDCVGSPGLFLQEVARLLAPGGLALLTTPYDWAQNATQPAAWFGGHSQRGPNGGAPEPVMHAHLAHLGLSVEREHARVPWTLRVHERADMVYAMHALACRRGGAGAGAGSGA